LVEYETVAAVRFQAFGPPTERKQKTVDSESGSGLESNCFISYRQTPTGFGVIVRSF